MLLPAYLVYWLLVRWASANHVPRVSHDDDYDSLSKLEMTSRRRMTRFATLDQWHHHNHRIEKREALGRDKGGGSAILGIVSGINLAINGAQLIKSCLKMGSMVASAVAVHLMAKKTGQSFESAQASLLRSKMKKVTGILDALSFVLEHKVDVTKGGYSAPSLTAGYSAPSYSPPATTYSEPSYLPPASYDKKPKKRPCMKEVPDSEQWWLCQLNALRKKMKKVKSKIHHAQAKLQPKPGEYSPPSGYKGGKYKNKPESYKPYPEPPPKGYPKPKGPYPHKPHGAYSEPTKQYSEPGSNIPYQEIKGTPSEHERPYNEIQIPPQQMSYPDPNGPPYAASSTNEQNPMLIEGHGHTEIVIPSSGGLDKPGIPFMNGMELHGMPSMPNSVMSLGDMELPMGHESLMPYQFGTSGLFPSQSPPKKKKELEKVEKKGRFSKLMNSIKEGQELFSDWVSLSLKKPRKGKKAAKTERMGNERINRPLPIGPVPGQEMPNQWARPPSSATHKMVRIQSQSLSSTTSSSIKINPLVGAESSPSMSIVAPPVQSHKMNLIESPQSNPSSSSPSAFNSKWSPVASPSTQPKMNHLMSMPPQPPQMNPYSPFPPPPPPSMPRPGGFNMNMMPNRRPHPPLAHPFPPPPFPPPPPFAMFPFPFPQPHRLNPQPPTHQAVEQSTPEPTSNDNEEEGGGGGVEGGEEEGGGEEGEVVEENTQENTEQ